MSEDAKRPNGTFINNREHLHALTETHIKQTELTFSPLKKYICRPIPVISCTKNTSPAPSWRYIDQAEKVPAFYLIA